jgi:predicted AAA+ superfamily ATPase
MFERIVKLSKTHSFFLFGARSTGKSTLLEMEFPPKTTLWIDLLDPELEERLSRHPAALKEIVSGSPHRAIVIDEIQKIPELLDVVHSLSKDKSLHFALTGSSARKLKRGGANLLAGRAFHYVCYPLTHVELGERFSLEEVLQFGSLPAIFSLNESEKADFLRAYVETYFKEEIVSEQIVRKLKPFKNFLQVAAQMNGKILNKNRIASNVGVDHITVQNYFEVLEDTLIGFLLEPFAESIRKRQRTAAKFYFFDTGVTRALKRSLEVPLRAGTYEYGEAFEHFIVLEIKRFIGYRHPDWQLSYLRTKDDAEIDLIIERPGMKRIAIEIKSTSEVGQLDAKTRSFSKLVRDLKNTEGYVFSQDKVEQKIDGIWCMPWKKGLAEIL